MFLITGEIDGSQEGRWTEERKCLSDKVTAKMTFRNRDSQNIEVKKRIASIYG